MKKVKAVKPKKVKKLKKFKAFKSVKATFYTAIRKANKNRPASSLEKLVYGWLEEDGVSFKKEKAIGKCHVDIFLEPDICIELNGCYWHGCTECFPEPTKTQKAAGIKDARRYSFFRKKEYRVVIIKECEVKNEPDAVRQLLRSLANVRK